MNVTKLNLSSIKEKPLIKTVWKNFAENDNRRFFEPFCVHNDNIGDVFVKFSKNPTGHENYRIDIENKLGKNLGYEIFSVENNKTRKIFGFDIKVEDKYQRRKYRLGELLRLTSIMEMLENKSPHIQICSKNTAVYFHGKYKFEPNITAFQERDDALKSICSDTAENFQDLVQIAKKLLKEAETTKDNAANQRELCVRTNALAKEYMQRALLEEKPEKNHPFKMGMYMILKSDTVVKFKEFFNELFKKHGIDYKIKDPHQ